MKSCLKRALHLKDGQILFYLLNEGGGDSLSFSRSARPLSTFLLSFAHFANSSCALVCKSSFFVARISDLRFLCWEEADELNIRK